MYYRAFSFWFFLHVSMVHGMEEENQIDWQKAYQIESQKAAQLLDAIKKYQSDNSYLLKENDKLENQVARLVSQNRVLGDLLESNQQFSQQKKSEIKEEKD